MSYLSFCGLVVEEVRVERQPDTIDVDEFTNFTSFLEKKRTRRVQFRNSRKIFYRSCRFLPWPLFFTTDSRAIQRNKKTLMTCDAITRKTGKRLWAWEMRKTLEKKNYRKRKVSPAFVTCCCSCGQVLRYCKQSTSVWKVIIIYT